jgi:SAM-dependent methyltransferase
MANPLLVFDTMNAFQRSAALRGALDLDLFTAIGGGATTAGEIAAKVDAAERGVRILADFLVTVGFLTKEDDRYRLSEEAAIFLDRSSPAYMGSAAVFLNSRFVMDSFADVAAAVRRGGTVQGTAGSLAPDHPVWVEFARGMAPLAALTAELVATLLEADAGARWRVLDVAAGHGMFGITLAKRNPRAEIVALDWSSVLEVAKENAQNARVADRFSTLPGSVFDVEPGTGYDLVLLPNILHHFDVAGCERVLRKAHAALAPGGRAVTVEFVPNPDRVTPPHASSFGLVMLVGTPGGDAYTFEEYDAMAREAGFVRSELHDIPPSPQRVVIAYR